MKKTLSAILSVLMIVTLVLCFTGCDGNKAPSTPAATQAVVTDAPATEATTVAETAAALAAGDKGEGPFTVDTNLITVTIPEGVSYEIRSLSDRDIRIFIGGSDNALEVSTLRMVKSQDDAVNECKRMNGTGDTMVITDLDDVTVGGATYGSMHFKSDYTDCTYYARYQQNTEGNDVYVEVSYNVPIFGTAYTLDDPVMVSVLESLIIK